MGTEEKKEIWKARMKEWERSGRTQQEWCEAEGYLYTQFKYWRKQINKEKNKGTTKFQYVPVENTAKEITKAPKELIAWIRIGKLEIEIKGESGPEFLQKLIREESAYV